MSSVCHSSKYGTLCNDQKAAFAVNFESYRLTMPSLDINPKYNPLVWQGRGVFVAKVCFDVGESIPRCGMTS